MEVLVSNLTKANDAYRNGAALLMTDEEYDAGLVQLAIYSPNHPLLNKVRASPTHGQVVRVPYYLGSLDKAKTAEELDKWAKKQVTESYLVSQKLDGISGLWNPVKGLLYLSGDDNTGLDVSPWLAHISLSPKTLDSNIPDVWIRGELIMPRALVPEGRLGRSIVNGIFHHAIPDPEQAKKVRFVGYEVIGMSEGLSMKQQFTWLAHWGMWLPWWKSHTALPSATELTSTLAECRATSEYDIDGLVIKSNKTQPRVTKGNPKDAVAWKPPNGETKLTKVVRLEWNASATGKLIPRVEIEPVKLGGSTITFVTGVNARRVVDWSIGPGATIILRKGGDVIPVIDSVEVPATVIFPPEGTYVWDGPATTAVNIKQVVSDTSTIIAQYTKMATKLGWEGIGPAQLKAVVEAGYKTVPELRKATEDTLKKLIGPVKGAHLFKTIQKDGWENATELDIFVASPICPSGIGRTRLEALKISQADITKWSQVGLIAPKGWSADSLQEFQTIWRGYEEFRKKEWNFLPYPLLVVSAPVVTVGAKGTVVFTGFRDSDMEAKLLAKGYKLADTVKSDTRAVFIADKEDPLTYTSSKIEKAKKIPGCRILRRADWATL